MKTKLAALSVMLAVSTSAFAGGHGHFGNHHHPAPRHHGHYSSVNTWVFPAIIGGVIGYEISRSQQQPPVVVQQPPIILQQPPVVNTPKVVYVYPADAPVPPGMICQMYSEAVNGQMVLRNYCQPL